MSTPPSPRLKRPFPMVRAPAAEAPPHRGSDRGAARRVAQAESIDAGQAGEPGPHARHSPRRGQLPLFATASSTRERDAHDRLRRAQLYAAGRPRRRGLISPWNLPLYLLSWKIAPAIAHRTTAKCEAVRAHADHRTMLARSPARSASRPASEPRARTRRQAAAHWSRTRASARSFHRRHGDRPPPIARTVAPLFKKLTWSSVEKTRPSCSPTRTWTSISPSIVRSAFANQARSCLCGSRILVEQSIHDRFLEQFVARVRSRRVGDPLLSDTDIGAVISAGTATRFSGTSARQRRGRRHRDRRIDSSQSARPLPTGSSWSRPSSPGSRWAAERTRKRFSAGGDGHAIPVRRRGGGAREPESVRPGGVGLDPVSIRAHRVAEAIQCGTIWITAGSFAISGSRSAGCARRKSVAKAATKRSASSPSPRTSA